jgi:hypothetical protein
VTNLNIRVARADGAAVWLNGQELFRTNLPVGPITFSNLALRTMTGFTRQIFYPTNVVSPAVQFGTNLLAVEIHAATVTNASLGFDLELFLGGTNIPAPTISASTDPSNLVLTWSAWTGAGYDLYGSTNLNGSQWSPVTNATETNSGQVLTRIPFDRVSAFYRLQRLLN